MKELNVLREQFKNRELRGIIYLAVLVMNVINIRLFMRYTYGVPFSRLLFPMLISGGITLALYYITDTLSSLITVTMFAAKIGKVFAAFMGALTAWMIGLGFLIQIMLTVMTYFAVIAGGAMFAYVFPIVFIPLFAVCKGLIRKLSGEPETVKPEQMQGTSDANMNWDHIYEGVISSVKENK